jgi:hypothetical protein
MKGIIAKINRARPMVAVKRENGDYSIFENLEGEDVGVGDQVE